VTLGPTDLYAIALLLGAGTLLTILARIRRPATLASYLLADRTLPAWLAGISISATSIWNASPLLTTGLLLRPDMVGGWLWWAGALGGLLTAAFFARLWRRSSVLTDVELVELRYGGRTAALLRAFRALYAALPLTLFALAWLTGLLVAALAPPLAIPPHEAAAILLAMAAAWAVLGGLRGLAAAHALTLGAMLLAGILVAVVSLGNLGGLGALRDGLARADSSLGPWTAGIAPRLPLSTLLAGMLVAWWSAWGLDSEPGGGGATAQRLLATRDERASSAGVLWSVALEFVLRPWPWILVGGVLMAKGYAHRQGGLALFSLVGDEIPTPLRGLVIGAVLLSYVGAAGTMLLRGAGYLVHDIYARFIHSTASASQRILAARLAILALAAGALACTVRLADPWHAFRLLLGLGAGSGLALMLRWYWWRVNGRAELLALGASFAGTIAVERMRLDAGDPRSGEFALAILVPAVAGVVATLVVTFFTAPESDAVLLRFYRQVRPGGPGWWTVAKWAGFKEDAISGEGRAWKLWVASAASLLGVTVAVGSLFAGRLSLAGTAAGATLVAAAAAALVFRPEKYWRREVDLHR
jgi:SSS family solute:Na+ symporter